ncbi:MAG: hypothetical protein LUG86_09460 [Oscillospiraceae bacterium]|nr:hypothetical protein [Oscillospiraceae bacterium]
MLCFVKLDGGGIWANPEEALGYLEKGYRVYTDTDQSVEVVEEDLKLAVGYDSRESKSTTVTVAAGAKG